MTNIQPAWVTQHRIFGSRLTALMEECSVLDEQLHEALCTDTPLPSHLVNRLEDLVKASFDAYGFSYKQKDVGDGRR